MRKVLAVFFFFVNTAVYRINIDLLFAKYSWNLYVIVHQVRTPQRACQISINACESSQPAILVWIRIFSHLWNPRHSVFYEFSFRQLRLKTILIYKLTNGIWVQIFNRNIGTERKLYPSALQNAFVAKLWFKSMIDYKQHAWYCRNIWCLLMQTFTCYQVFSNMFCFVSMKPKKSRTSFY